MFGTTCTKTLNPPFNVNVGFITYLRLKVRMTPRRMMMNMRIPAITPAILTVLSTCFSGSMLSESWVDASTHTHTHVHTYWHIEYWTEIMSQRVSAGCDAYFEHQKINTFYFNVKRSPKYLNLEYILYIIVIIEVKYKLLAEKWKSHMWLPGHGLQTPGLHKYKQTPMVTYLSENSYTEMHGSHTW